MSFFNWFPILSFLIFAFILSGRIYYLKQNSIKVSSGSAKTGKVKLSLYLVFLLIMLLWLFEIIKPAFQISVSVFPDFITIILVESLYLKIAGVFLISFSLIFLVVTLFHFKNSLRFGMDEKNKGELITTGIFSLSRNPFFLSIDLYFLGISLVLPNLFFIGFAVLALVSIHFFILKEEKFMVEIYGRKYLEYLRNVGRYF
jgi:protein-S-isoprenylcysteine O-methyltransferase Ste14